MNLTIKCLLAAVFLTASVATANAFTLHLFTRIGDAESVHELLHDGYNPNARLDGITPLHEAAYHGATRIAEILLDHGADPDLPIFFTTNNPAEGISGITALHMAVMAKSYGVAEALLDRGADPNAAAISTDDRIVTPLRLALQRNYERFVDLLQTHGATLD